MFISFRPVQPYSILNHVTRFHTKLDIQDKMFSVANLLVGVLW